MIFQLIVSEKNRDFNGMLVFYFTFAVLSKMRYKHLKKFYIRKVRSTLI